MGNNKPYSTLKKVFIVFFSVLLIVSGAIFLLMGISVNDMRFFIFAGVVLFLCGIWTSSLISKNKKSVKVDSKLESKNNKERVDNQQKERLEIETI